MRISDWSSDVCSSDLLAEDRETRLVEAWPRATKVDRRRFELAKRAYVEARYSAAYDIGSDDLKAIRSAVTMLRDTVETVSREWLARLRQKARPEERRGGEGCARTCKSRGSAVH